jgi:hypothetical protein
MVRRAGVLLACTAACTSSFPDTTSIVTAPRLLAVQAVPAEVAPGAAFAMTALYVGPDGVADPSSVDWSLCVAQKPLGDPDPVASACQESGSASLLPLGRGGSASGTMPSNACELFGPESPPPQPGQPAARPTDPDATGGYYLPVSIDTGAGAWSSASERITCQPSGVTQAVFNAFSAGYLPNENPSVASLSLVNADGSTTPLAPDAPGAGSALTLPGGQHSTFQVAWPSCPATPTSCAGAETFVLIDPTSKQITTSRESMVASWYATSGTFDLDRSGRDGTDPLTTANNGWSPPTSPGTVHLWVVLRDARGGIGWASYTVEVE